MTAKSTVAVLGLGAMGHAFAANLIKAGFTTHVWNRSPERARDLGQAGATVALSPADAVKEADVVISMAADGEVTQSILLGEHAAIASFKQGAVLAQMGTIGVAATEHLIEQVHQQRPDVIYIDAPVSGTKGPAEQGQVVVLASGDATRGAAVKPVFEAIAKHTHWLGQAGAGSRMKLVVNAWLAQLTQGLAESARLAEALGFGIDDFWSVLDGGPLAAPYAKIKLQMMAKGDFDAQFQLALALKDVRLALAAGGDQPLPALQAIASSWGEAVDDGAGTQDLSVIYRQLRPRGSK